MSANHNTEILQDVKVSFLVEDPIHSCTSAPGANSHKECLQKECGGERTSFRRKYRLCWRQWKGHLSGIFNFVAVINSALVATKLIICQKERRKTPFFVYMTESSLLLANMITYEEIAQFDKNGPG